ncbi:hypothetical protein DFQ30_003646, partial [Apophysomyces sp. BC1015]
EQEMQPIVAEPVNPVNDVDAAAEVTEATEDWELLGLTVDEIQEVHQKFLATWNPGSDSYLRNIKSGWNFRREFKNALLAKKQDLKEKERIAKQCRQIDSYFMKTTRSEARDNHRADLNNHHQKSIEDDSDKINRNERELFAIKSHFNKLDQEVKTLADSNSKCRRLNAYEAIRLLSVHRYFVYWLNGVKKLEASL